MASLDVLLLYLLEMMKTAALRDSKSDMLQMQV